MFLQSGFKLLSVGSQCLVFGASASPQTSRIQAKRKFRSVTTVTLSNLSSANLSLKKNLYP